MRNKIEELASKAVRNIYESGLKDEAYEAASCSDNATSNAAHAVILAHLLLQYAGDTMLDNHCNEDDINLADCIDIIKELISDLNY